MADRVASGVAVVLFAILLAIVAAPLAVVVAGSVLDPGLLGLSSETWHAGARHATWFDYVLSLYGRHLVRSGCLAAAVVVLSFGLGAPAAYGLSRREDAFSRSLGALLDAPLAVPGLAVAIGLLLAYPRARASGATLAAGHLVYALPFFVRAARNALSSGGLPSSKRRPPRRGPGGGSASGESSCPWPARVSSPGD